jgi:outer membrane protein
MLTLAGSAAKVEAQKIGVVDLQRALNETEEGRQAKAKLKSLFDKRQKTLDKQQNDIKTMKEGLEKQKSVLAREALAKKIEEYQQAFGQLQGTYMEFQRELAAKEAEFTQPILEKMQQIVRRIGQKDGYAVIIDRAQGGVVYTPSAYDITDILIQRYNAGEGGKSKAKSKGAAKGKKK